MEETQASFDGAAQRRHKDDVELWQLTNERYRSSDLQKE